MTLTSFTTCTFCQILWSYDEPLIPHRYGHKAKIVHFLGSVKPWHLRSTSQIEGNTGPSLGQFANLWWEEYLNHTVPHVTHTETTPSQPSQDSGKQKDVRLNVSYRIDMWIRQWDDISWKKVSFSRSYQHLHSLPSYILWQRPYTEHASQSCIMWYRRGYATLEHPSKYLHCVVCE